MVVEIFVGHPNILCPLATGDAIKWGQVDKYLYISLPHDALSYLDSNYLSLIKNSTVNIREFFFLCQFGVLCFSIL